MSTSYTYPGIYIQELQSNSHAITAAPTSITVFVGYTHPFLTKTENWGEAVEIFSFTDYEQQFGGLYTSGVIESHVAHAVNNFFLNGGSDAYVVALQPSYYDSSGNNQGLVTAAGLQVGVVTFAGLQPIDLVAMTVTINNVQTTYAANDTADVSISYGSRSETYRKVNLKQGDANYIVSRINSVSQLISVSGTPAGAFTAIGQAPLGYASGSAPNPDWTAFSEIDFVPVFQQDSSLDKVSVFNLLLVPGVADSSIWSEAQAFCERKMAFVIMDPPRQDSADGYGGTLPMIASDMESSVIPKSANGALYFPYLESDDPLTGNTLQLPPSGFVAGMYSTTDNKRGVWKAPAGLQTIINNTIGVVDTGLMTDARQGTLNPIGVNCLRDFPNVGTVIWSSRTLVTANTAMQQWQYVPVRRMALFLEQTLYSNLGWAVFEPNDEPLWVALRSSVEAFMLSLFNQGAFQGDQPSKAFQVLCDDSTTTQQDIDTGIVNILVAFAPLKPAEFVVVKIAQLAGQSQS